MDVREFRRIGVALLTPTLAPHGFVYQPGEADRGSGGNFAQGAFVLGTRRLEFSVRQSLGLVYYRIAEQTISHEDYMRVAAGRGNYRYPGFSAEPLDGFLDLAADLEHLIDAVTVR